MRVGIIGATGNMGYGLALRLARLGYEVCIGSRSREKALAAAQRAKDETGMDVEGLDNQTACQNRDLIILAVPAAGHRSTLEELKDAIGSTPVLDVTIPMAFSPLRYAPPSEGSCALETLAILGEGAKVACGFHTVSAAMLSNLSKVLTGDLLVAGNDTVATELVLSLGTEMGLRSFNAGELHHAAVLEALTPMIIGMNKRYKRGHIGVALTGI